MPPRSRLNLPPLGGDETIGQRLARLRKQRGLTQVELAKQVGTIQALVSDYERDRLRLSAEMAARFAQALGVSTDQMLLDRPAAAPAAPRPSRRILRRLEQIEKLPRHQQAALLTTIDLFLKSARSS